MLTRIADLPDNRSFFLFGPRQTGKSSLIQARFNNDCWTLNLLHGEEYARYAKHPAQYRLDVSVVYRGTQAFRIDDIRVIPWEMFLDEARQDILSGQQ
jgi:hypothetical protein